MMAVSSWACICPGNEIFNNPILNQSFSIYLSEREGINNEALAMGISVIASLCTVDCPVNRLNQQRPPAILAS
jgi:hypothetical protein